jgi:glutathione synthase
MVLQLGVIMDPIEAINIKHDSTFAMLLEAQRRSWPIFYFEQKDLFIKNNAVCAIARKLRVFDDAAHWFELEMEQSLELRQLDVILMRKDPPIDMDYIYTTQLLDRVAQSGTLVVNKPQSLRDFNEKLFIEYFPQCIPPTLVTARARQVHEFLQQHEDIICKPLDGMGGQGIFRLTKDDPNINVVIEQLTQRGTRQMMAQRFIPEIIHGDKRILLLDGEPVSYALARVPARGETRANIAAGGHGIGVELSKHDRWLCQQIAPLLQEKGILFAGVDVIGDYITEINITSPTCIRELDTQFSLNISAQLLDCVVKYCA